MRRLAALEPERVDDMLHDFLHRPQFGAHEHIGVAVKGFAFGQQLTDFRERVGCLEQGTVRLMVDPLPNGLRRRPKANDQCVSFQAGQAFFTAHQSATGGDDRSVEVLEILHHGPLVFAEPRLAFLGEDGGNGFASPRLDEFVGIDEAEVQLRGHELSDGGLARPHEADQSQVVDVARGAHHFDLLSGVFHEYGQVRGKGFSAQARRERRAYPTVDPNVPENARDVFPVLILILILISAINYFRVGADVPVLSGRNLFSDQFPPTAEVLKSVIRFCREAIDNDETAVLLGYSLGKSQELLRGLADAGLPITLHESVFKLAQIYERLGQTFPRYGKFKGRPVAGHVLICPPLSNLLAVLRRMGRVRTAVLTGWAVDPNCRFRYQTDAAFPLSDHADFTDLVEFVKRVAPRRVFTLHGFAADFAQTLRELGFDARALSEEEQLALPLEGSSFSVQAPSPREARTGRRLGRGVSELGQQPSSPRPSPPLVGGEGEVESLRRGLNSMAVPGPLPASQGEGVQRPSSGETLNPTVVESATGSDLSIPQHGFLRFAETCRAIGAAGGKLEKVRLLADYLRTLEGKPLAWVCHRSVQKGPPWVEIGPFWWSKIPHLGFSLVV